MFTYIVLMFGVTQDPCFQHEVSLKKRSNNVFIKSDFIHKINLLDDVKTEILYFSPCANLSEATSSSWEDILHRYPGGSGHEDCHLLCALLPEGHQSLPNLWSSTDSKDRKTSLVSYVKVFFPFFVIVDPNLTDFVESHLLHDYLTLSRFYEIAQLPNLEIFWCTYARKL